MSLFSWFSPKRKSEKHAPSSAPSSSGLSRMESTKPFHGTKQAGGNGQPANRKHERMARRELLYAVVREAMVKAGVLSASYKFKVLSLDSRGRQFLVMVDLAQGAGNDTARLAEIEAMVAQAAKTRYDIIVTAVYWRSNEHVAVGDPVQRTAAAPSRPAPLETLPEPPVSQPAELRAAPPERPAPKADPLLVDEVAAFKKALAQGASNADALAAAHAAGASARSFDGANKHGPQSYTLLTGFEDTEMAGEDTPAPGALSTTQYGELR